MPVQFLYDAKIFDARRARIDVVHLGQSAISLVDINMNIIICILQIFFLEIYYLTLISSPIFDMGRFLFG